MIELLEAAIVTCLLGAGATILIMLLTERRK